MSRFVSVTTDFGPAYTSICAGVVYTIAPEATVLVISGDVPKYDVQHGAMLLRQALPYLPVGVHLGIVDPGVGTARDPVAVVTGRGDVLVGPDNGLLLPAAAELGGATAAYRLESPEYRLPEVSSTFHGRDVFAPAAGHLTRGVAPSALGPGLAVESLRRLELPQPVVGRSELAASVLYLDDFGSLVLAADESHLHAAFGPVPYGTVLTASWTRADGERRQTQLPYQHTFGAVEPGRPLLFRDSSGWLAVAVNQDSATGRFGIGRGAVLRFTRSRV